jgi:hypothetical protein
MTANLSNKKDTLDNPWWFPATSAGGFLFARPVNVLGKSVSTFSEILYKFWKDKIAIPVRRFFDQKRGSQGVWSKTASIR